MSDDHPHQPQMTVPVYLTWEDGQWKVDRNQGPDSDCLHPQSCYCSWDCQFDGGTCSLSAEEQKVFDNPPTFEELRKAPYARRP